MTFFYDWIRNIAVFMILVSVIVNLLPKNHYEKYVRLFTGMVMIILLIKPVSTLFQLSDRLDRVFTLDIWKQELTGLELDFAGLSEELEDKRMETYGEQLKGQVAFLLEEEGVELVDLEYEICLEKEEENYGKITNMKVYLAKQGVSKVDSVFLKEYENAENSRIKERICEYYQLEREQVKVYG